MNVTDFRKNLKQAFNDALAGREVVIMRGGVFYRLTADIRKYVPKDFNDPVPERWLKEPKTVSEVIQRTVTEGEKMLRDTPKIKSEPKGLDWVREVVKPLTLLEPGSDSVCKKHGTPLTEHGKCLQKGH